MSAHPPQDQARDRLARFIADSLRLAREIVEAPDATAAYQRGMELLALSMDHIARGDDVKAAAWPLWLIWGSLTDRLDGTAAPDDPNESVTMMQRAAEEWIAMAGEPAARTAYLDRWVHDECGYERPS